MKESTILENYETVKQRKKRFYKDNPDGSLISEIYFFEKGHIVIMGKVFRNKEEQEKNLPSGIGIAEEFQGQGGFANKHSWTENCCESAIGRGLDNSGYSGNDKCSREEMEKVQEHSKVIEKTKGDFETAVKELNTIDFKLLGVSAKRLKTTFKWTPEEEGRLKITIQERMEAENGGLK